ncbi:MAG: MAPEG family protein [Pseudomonadota bacterium]
MTKTRVFLGAGLGLMWSLLLLAGAAMFLPLPVFALIPTIMTAFLAPGLVMAFMVGRVAQRRFFEADAGMGPLSEAGEVDRRVLHNTTEQLVLAATIWPAAAVLLGPYGPGVIIALGVGFALARLVYWAGCHRSGTQRVFGFAATFYPTVLVAIWAVGALVF